MLHNIASHGIFFTLTQDSPFYSTCFHLQIVKAMSRHSLVNKIQKLYLYMS